MRRVLKIGIIGLIAVIVLPLLVVTILYRLAMRNFAEPDISISLDDYSVSTWSDSVRICKNNTLVLNSYGLWEAKIEGSAVERGAVWGSLSKDLLQNQERVFVEQIHRFVPSERYIRFLLKLIAIFNRNMVDYIPVEYLEEIWAVSLSCSHEYDGYGTPYARQLNYHAAHDIGHAMQEYMLVGCSSFAAWNEESADGGLIVGRNFDFYVGDEFAKNKIVLFVRPEKGYNYVSVTWPGMMGVVSGMNERGLTVTINAAKGAIPTSSAMPVSLLARHILQYAQNIREAYDMAESCQTFVSESLLIGSAVDGQAAIIEKTPKETRLYSSGLSHVICTNHYQSDGFADDRYNAENMAESDSKYRYDRLSELIGRNIPLTPEKSVDILRNRLGLHDADIGLTNEKSVNQFIAHHAVVFEPERLKIWVSTEPWQCGVFLCYDMNEVFADDKPRRVSMAVADEQIPADTLFFTEDSARLGTFRRQTVELQNAIGRHLVLSEDFIERYIGTNPNLYAVYDWAGDYALQAGERNRAVACWKTALTKEIPHLSDRRNIMKKIKRYDQE